MRVGVNVDNDLGFGLLHPWYLGFGLVGLKSSHWIGDETYTAGIS